MLPKPRWRTSMYIVAGKNAETKLNDYMPEDVRKFVLKHNKGWGKEEMMKKFPEVQESKKEEKGEVPKFEVEQVVKESSKEVEVQD